MNALELADKFWTRFTLPGSPWPRYRAEQGIPAQLPATICSEKRRQTAPGITVFARVYPRHVQLRHSKLPHTNSQNLFIETHSVIVVQSLSLTSSSSDLEGHQHACTQESSETFRSWGFFSNRLLIIPFTNLRFIFLILFSGCNSLQMKSNFMELSS
ncbi:hypothetical protein NL676_008705 [Syzygium grande]|nr:hypothetical protein NL676_008705 [Syzygium grande]